MFLRIAVSSQNSLPGKFLDRSKLKAFADDRIKVTEKTRFVLEMIENIMGKGENAGYQHFLTIFSKGFIKFFKVIESQDCVVKS